MINALGRDNLEQGTTVPAQVADQLRGRTFRNFGHFREAFWLAVSECPELVEQFSSSNQLAIKAGNAPNPIPTEQIGGRKTFEIHHVEHIQYGGAVYNVDNLRVNTPKNHIKLHSSKSGDVR